MFETIEQFKIDERLSETSIYLVDWPLSRVLLKNESQVPWFVLVPRRTGIEEIYQLLPADRQMLMEEINQLSLVIKEFFKPKKLNIGALGNIVGQLHGHVVGREVNDPWWPQGIWQSSLPGQVYLPDELADFLPELKQLMNNKNIMFP
jgi:diadenosine tetraphosphate (Ap4A) HIT family hydrolase